MQITQLESERQRLLNSARPAELEEVITEARATYRDDPEMASLAIMAQVPGFLRSLVLDVAKQQLPDGDLTCRDHWDQDIWREFVMLAHGLGIAHVDTRTGSAWMEPEYRAAVRQEGSDSVRVLADRADYRAMVGFLAEASDPAGRPVWLDRSDVAYFPIMTKYFLEIANMSFDGRVPIEQGTAFCSDLGEAAFLNFTQPTFESLLQKYKPSRFVDIGCGEGRHVIAAAQHPDVETATGIELDEAVALSARQRADDAGVNVTIHAGDARSAPDVGVADMVFACYMLFYLDQDGQRELLGAAIDRLADDGRLVICQYFPDVRDYQAAMLAQLPPSDQMMTTYAAQVANSCIDTEVLLNRTMTHFRSVIYWHELRGMLSDLGLEVEALTPADPLYYSHYVVARRKEP